MIWYQNIQPLTNLSWRESSFYLEGRKKRKKGGRKGGRKGRTEGTKEGRREREGQTTVLYLLRIMNLSADQALCQNVYVIL